MFIEFENTENKKFVINTTEIKSFHSLDENITCLKLKEDKLYQVKVNYRSLCALLEANKIYISAV